MSSSKAFFPEHTQMIPPVVGARTVWSDSFCDIMRRWSDCESNVTLLALALMHEIPCVIFSQPILHVKLPYTFKATY